MRGNNSTSLLPLLEEKLSRQKLPLQREKYINTDKENPKLILAAQKVRVFLVGV